MRTRRYILERFAWLAAGVAIGAVATALWLQWPHLNQAHNSSAVVQEGSTGPAKVTAPPRSAASFEPPIRAALAHLGIEQIGEDVTSPAYNLRVSKGNLTKTDLEELDEPQNGGTKYKDLAKLNSPVMVYCVTVQQGFADTSVWVTEDGHVLLVKCLPEG